ncbi:MAG: SEC-C motif-containing protein, partial [Myxococcota bacterium]
PTAEILMRSRYSAYARGEVDYVVRTHDPEKRLPALRESVAKWAAGAQFKKLEVLDTEAGGESDQRGIVEFEATFIEEGESRTLRERSSFIRRQGRWFYSKGITPSQQEQVRVGPKTGRNDPCSCGSGKKFKKCCG